MWTEFAFKTPGHERIFHAVVAAPSLQNGKGHRRTRRDATMFRTKRKDFESQNHGVTAVAASLNSRLA